MHAASWIVALMAPILPMFSPPRTLPRMISVFLGFASTYGLFSVSYESLFYACLGFCLLSWMILERGLQAPSPAKSKMFTRTIIPSDLRHAAMFLFLIDAAFFGTGNIASIASFDLSSVYRFTTRFNPFLMGALLVLKVLLPMITVAAAFLVVLKSSRVPAFESYFMFLILSDIMAVRFFFQITTVGSWLDIGSSVSRYALMGTQVVTILPFLALAQIFTRALPVNGRTAIIRTKRD
jgi:phosphatidylinositol glycan class N